MAVMGTEGQINITKDMMKNAVEAIDAYQKAINGYNSELETEITGLIPTNFSGSAATGFKHFYDNQVKPNIETNLTSMLNSLKGVCNTISKQIPGDSEGVDDKLGEGNKNPGKSAEQN